MKASQPLLPHSGEVFRLRGETPVTLRYLLTMRKGSNNVEGQGVLSQKICIN